MGGLTKRKFFSHSSRGWKSGIRVPTWSGSGESSLPGLQTATSLLCAHMEEREIRSSLMYLFFFDSSHGMLCVILVSQPGMNPSLLQCKLWFLTISLDCQGSLVYLLVRALIHSLGSPSSWTHLKLITSQRTHLQYHYTMGSVHEFWEDTILPLFLLFSH